MVSEREGRLVYGGNPVKAEINKNDVFDTLARAGLFREKDKKPKIYPGEVNFDVNGESSIGSRWCGLDDCFVALSDSPSYRDFNGLVAFVKTDIAKPQIIESLVF